MPRILLLIFVLLISLSAQAQLANGLIAHWPMNGNANDVTGNGHNGTPGNVTSVAGKSGLPNTAYLFNNVNSVITVPYQSDLNVTALTICALVKPLAFYQGLCQGNWIFFRGVEHQPGTYGLGFYDNPYNDCYVMDTNLHVFYTQVEPIGFGHPTWASNTKAHTGQWYCLVTTYANGTIKMFVDGVLVASGTLPAVPIGTSSTGIGIGKYIFGGTTYPYNFNGIIDDIRLYNRALHDTEVVQYCGLTSLPDTSVFISQPLNKTSFCPGDTVHVQYSVTSSFNPGNVFTAQLSNATGSFAAAVNVGSVTATGGGTIVCTIPAGTLAGTGYRIRISASSPPRLSVDNGVNLTVKAFANVTVSPKSKNICIGDSVILTASGASSYNWSPANGLNTATGATVIAKPTINTQYIVTGSDPAFCDDADTVTITISPYPQITVTPETDTLCNGGSVSLTANGAANYSWSPAAGLNTTTGATVIATPAVTTQYIIAGTSDGFACAGFDTATIYVGNSVSTGIEFKSCTDTTLYLGSQTIIAPGVYTEVFKTTLGCDSTVTVSFTKLITPVAKFSHSPVIPVKNEPVSFHNESKDAESYLWKFDDQQTSTEKDPVHMYRRTGVYNVCLVAESIDGCQDTVCHDAEAEIDPAIGVPSGFSPNGDGHNDILLVRGVAVAEMRLRIYNRWGQMIFETTSMDKGWDGTYNGQPQGVEVVAYVLAATFINGETYRTAGNITIIR